MAYNSAYTGAQVDAAVGAVRNKETTWDGKQNKLSGTNDQLVGFNSAGDAIPVAKPTAAEVGAIPDPGGGTAGQILTRTSSGVAWEDAPEGGVTSFNGRTGAITPQAGDYTAEMVGAVSEEDVGVANGVAELDSTGKVPTSQLPSMDYIPTSEKGANSGVATLDASGKLASTQKPTYTADEVGARPNTWTPSAADVGALPSGTTLAQLPDDASHRTVSDTEKSTWNAKAGKPKYLTITLTSGGWSSNSQTVTATGVLADETAQLIQPMPASASQSAYYAAGILCTGQAENSLTFTCTTVPTADLTVYVVIQEVSA